MNPRYMANADHRKPVCFGNFFMGTTCSRFMARVMRKHEDRRLRVIQLGTRVTVLIDLEACRRRPDDRDHRPPVPRDRHRHRTQGPLT